MAPYSTQREVDPRMEGSYGGRYHHHHRSSPFPHGPTSLTENQLTFDIAAPPYKNSKGKLFSGGGRGGADLSPLYPQSNDKSNELKSSTTNRAKEITTLPEGEVMEKAVWNINTAYSSLSTQGGPCSHPFWRPVHNAMPGPSNKQPPLPCTTLKGSPLIGHVESGG
ncbi:MAG: hypothetical protein J3Q66DRAFT_321313, partial [Benniella sp.]